MSPRGHIRDWLVWPRLFARLTFALFICLPIILLDDWWHNRKQRRKHGH